MPVADSGSACPLRLQSLQWVHCWWVAVWHLAEVHEGCGAPLLLLLAVDVLHGDVDVVEQLCMVLHRIAGREEHHHL